MFSCRISSFTTFTSSPFPLRSVAYVCRNVCQPKWPTIPISFAAGSRCALYSEPGQYGSFPPLGGLANTQSSSVGYGLCSRQFHKTLDSRKSSGTGLREASVLQAPTCCLTLG